MSKARAWIALASLLCGLGTFFYQLVIERDPLAAIGVLTAGLVVGELVRPGDDTIRAHVERAQRKG